MLKISDLAPRPIVSKLLHVHVDIYNSLSKFEGGVSDVVSVSCFGVRVSVMFHFMFVHYMYF